MRQLLLLLSILAISVQAAIKDIAILGGGHAAVAAAEILQAKGWHAFIIDRHNHIGGELAYSNHSWLKNGSTDESLPLPVGALQKELMVRALDSGAMPMPLAHCAGFIIKDNAIQAVVVATKYGTALLPVAAVIDASAEQLAASHLIGIPDGTATAEFNFEITNASAFTGNRWEFPDTILTLHKTIKPGSLNLSCHTDVTLPPSDWLAASRLEMTLRKKAVDLVRQIRSRIPGLQSAHLDRIAEMRLIRPERPLPAVRNLLRLQAALPKDPTTNDIRSLERLADQKVNAFTHSLVPAEPSLEGALQSTGQTLQYKLDENVNPAFNGLPLKAITVVPQEAAKFDVIVIGGGTGGSSVMAALAQQNINALTVDMLPFLGGTTTAGGVSGAWHGYVKGAYADYCHKRDAIAKTEFLSRFCGAVRLWDTYFMSPDTHQTFLGSAVVCDTQRNGNDIESVTVYSANGFRHLKARFFLDMTGEADLCAQAGLPTSLGDPDTGWIQSSSCWGIDEWSIGNYQSKHYSNDIDIVDPTEYLDVIRGIAQAHRFNSDYFIAPIYTQRESRRIRGDAYLNVPDIFRRKFQPDAIAVASCLFDSHGRLSSELALSYTTPDAYSPDNHEIHVLIPAGVFRPQNIRNLLVGSKAISGERDATTLCRMNPEITNAGFALGTMAALCIKNNLSDTRDVNINDLRKRLHEAQILPDWAMAPAVPEWTTEFAMERLKDPRGFLPAVLMPRNIIVPLLKAKMASVPDKQTARALAWFGLSDGQHFILNEALKAFENDAVRVVDNNYDVCLLYDKKGNEFKAEKRNSYGMPQFGELPPWRSFDTINRALITLSHLDTPDSMEFALNVAAEAWGGADTLSKGTTPYSIARLDGVRTYFHARLWAIAIFFNRRPTPKAIPALERLLNQPLVSGNHTKQFWGPLPPMQNTYVEIMLANALRNCGGTMGTERLREFSKDSRSIFRHMAERCLNNPLPAASSKQDNILNQ